MIIYSRRKMTPDCRTLSYYSQVDIMSCSEKSVHNLTIYSHVGDNGSSCLCGERLHHAGQLAAGNLTIHHKKQSLSSLVQVSFYSSSSKVSRSLHGMRRKLSSNPSLGHDQLALRRVSVVAVDPVSRWRFVVPGGRAGRRRVCDGFGMSDQIQSLDACAMSPLLLSRPVHIFR
jgi:hypothetical protein